MPTFGVLGSLRVVGDDGAEIVVAGRRQRRLLSALLLHRGRVVSVDRLVALAWGEVPVDGATLHSLVFRLRRRVPGLDLEFRMPGYVLRVDDDQVDAARFERTVHDATARRADDPASARELLDVALALWRGEPYDDLADGDDARFEVARLVELRCRALEERFELRIDEGDASDVIADLEAFALGEALRERPQLLLMRAYAVLGRRADALRVYDAYRRRLADELGVAPSPELRQRHEALLAADEVVLPVATPRSPYGVRRPLRRPTSSFVGQDDLVATIPRLLSEARVVTLVGPGGVGKTRLATEIAHRLVGHQVDELIFCDLASASPGGVVDVVIGAAAVEHRVERADVDRLVEVLRDERCCVVLDNCEHVIDEAAEVAERLVDSTAQVVVLATSRERLAVDGERIVAVTPLDSDAGPSSPATRLLVDRMVAATGRVPDEDEVALLGELARRLDGLPLALELAAGRLQSLSVRDVLEGVEGGIALLRGGRRTVDRHRSVDAALLWSYEVLDERARATLRAAATFAASHRPADVAALLSIERHVAVERLSELVERSLVQRDGDRLRLLHVVRTFVLERTEPAERDRLRAALARRMWAVASGLRDDLRSATTSAPIDEYLARVADFRGAIDSSLRAGDPECALGIVVALRDLAFNSASFELERWAEDAAEAGERAGHPAAVDAYAVAGLAAWKRGALDDTGRLLTHAEHLMDRWGIDPTYEWIASQATAELARGDLDRAIERLEFLARSPVVRDDAIRHAETVGTLVICKAYAHRPDAVATADVMVATFVDHPAALARAWAHYASGECRLDIDPVRARRHLELAIELARAGGSTFVEGIAGASLASLDVRSGEIDAAIATYRWLLPLWSRAGLQTPFWTAMRSVAELLVRAGEYVTAVHVLGAVLTQDGGHSVFGADVERLDELCARLRDLLGPSVFDDIFRAGAMSDEAAVAREATAAFDRVGHGAA